MVHQLTGILLGLLLTFGTAFGGWYDPAWEYRKSFTVDPTKVPSTVTIPVYVRLTGAAQADLRGAAKADGSDLVVTLADGTTRVDRELVSYTQSEGGVLYFRAEVDGTDPTTFYVYYGNADGSEANTTTPFTGFKGAWHLDSGSGADSSPYGKTITWTNVSIADTTGGFSGGSPTSRGIDLNGTDEYGNITSYQTTTVDFTILMWVYLAPGAVWQNVLWFMNGSVGPWATEATPQWHFYDGAADRDSNANVTQGSWRLMACKVSGTTDIARIWVNGSDVSGDLTHTTVTSSSTVNLFHYVTLYPWEGKIDEVWVLDSVASEDYLDALYANQSGYSTFFTVGSQETPPEAPIGVLARSFGGEGFGNFDGSGFGGNGP